MGDICQQDAVRDAFKCVDTVFHCAALVSLQYPPNYKELNRVNVDGKAIFTEKHKKLFILYIVQFVLLIKNLFLIL